MKNTHMDYLEQIAQSDVIILRHKEKTYGGSWKKRGGVGAFMMLARKMDRIENIAAEAGYDIFSVIEKQGIGGADGDLIAEIRDLRCYLMLVEAEMTSHFAQDIGPLVEQTNCVEDTELGAMREYMEDKIRAKMARRTEHPAPFGYTEKDEI